MSDHENSLRGIKVGDFFHASFDERGSMICLATAVSDRIIHARRITTQTDHQFDRATGIEHAPTKRFCKIDSVAPLPMEIRDVFLNLDKRYRTSTDPDRSKLTKTEIQAILFIDSHYPANPI